MLKSSKKPTPKKLSLGRETIAELRHLDGIAAGVQTSTGPISMDDPDACSLLCPKK